MGGQAAEQIIAGVVLSERLAVTMYGAIHRAQFGGQRNLRGLVVDPKMLAEDAFRLPLTDPKALGVVTKLDHPAIVPTMTVESGGPDVVIVTRGVGRYVTVQDLITAAKARSRSGGKLSTPIAALIGKSVIEALAVAHKSGVIHGAVHPRSVLIDEDGTVRLGDFVVGRALTTAVAQGADSSLWRGLAGYIAPELVVGEDPTPGADVFAVGAMLFTMLSGEVPPGTLRVTPAVERLVQRALDTDPQRRYKNASDLLDNFLEAIEDDRWETAERGELVREAGLQTADGNIDDATEDLLASLGSSPVKLTNSSADKALRPSSPMLSGLDENTGITNVDEKPFTRDPISEVIRQNPRKKEAIISSARVPSLDDPDDETPLPPPTRESDLDMSHAPPRSASHDEKAAMAALGLDEGAKRVNTAAERLEQAAARAEAAAKRAETSPPAATPRRGQPIGDPIVMDDLPPPRLKSRWPGIIALVVLAGGGYGFYRVYKQQQADRAAQADRDKKAKEDEDAAAKLQREAAPDPGSISVASVPGDAGVWLRIGRTPVDTMHLEANNSAEFGLLLDGYEMTEAQVGGVHWQGAGKTQKATISVAMKKGKKHVDLPLQPTALHITTGVVGGGPIHVESTPSGAEVWLFVGITGTMRFNKVTAGRDYELAVVKDGYKVGHVYIKADEWRTGNNPNIPIDSAPKKELMEKTIELEPAKGK